MPKALENRRSGISILGHCIGEVNDVAEEAIVDVDCEIEGGADGKSCPIKKVNDDKNDADEETDDSSDDGSGVAAAVGNDIDVVRMKGAVVGADDNDDDDDAGVGDRLFG